MKRTDNFIDLTIAFQTLTAEASLIVESCSWCYAMTYTFHMRESGDLLGDVQTYRENIHAFRNQLAYYIDNYIDLDKLSDTHTTDKFFSEVVATMRSRAQKSLSNLRRCFNKYSNNQTLLDAIEDLKNATNDYIDLCINIIMTNPRLKRQRDLLGVETLIEKYDLHYLK